MRLLLVPDPCRVLTEEAWWILAIVVGVLTILFAVNHDKIVTVSTPLHMSTAIEWMLTYTGFNTHFQKDTSHSGRLRYPCCYFNSDIFPSPIRP